MAHLTKEQILAGGRKRQTVTIEALGGEVTLQRMGALDFWKMKKRGKALDWDDAEQVFAFTVDYLILAVIDPASGAPLCGDDRDAWAAMDPEIIDKLFAAALELHGVRKDAIEDVEKNSEKTASSAGGSASVGCAATPTPTTCSPS